MSKKTWSLREFWTDSSTGDLSTSRFCTWYAIVILFPIMLGLQAWGCKLGRAWDVMLAIVGVSGIAYGGNSVARVWKNRTEPLPQMMEKPQEGPVG
ncbi:MAG: hypothetical protein A2Y80_00685 [Deltaproteobacteria bacterium RBG_13_58_19]|nr:MAG: hypothetical protein A2Y80_00685 [Deltaproteobacteria bacterium RBG_13_58_19]